MNPHHVRDKADPQAVTVPLQLPGVPTQNLSSPLKMIWGRKWHGWEAGGAEVHRKAGRRLKIAVPRTGTLSKNVPGQKLIMIIIPILRTKR